MDRLILYPLAAALACGAAPAHAAEPAGRHGGRGAAAAARHRRHRPARGIWRPRDQHRDQDRHRHQEYPAGADHRLAKPDRGPAAALGRRPAQFRARRVLWLGRRQPRPDRASRQFEHRRFLRRRRARRRPIFPRLLQRRPGRGAEGPERDDLRPRRRRRDRQPRAQAPEPRAPTAS